MQRLDHLVAHSAAAGVVGAVVGVFIVVLVVLGVDWISAAIIAVNT